MSLKGHQIAKKKTTQIIAINPFSVLQGHIREYKNMKSRF